MICEFYDLGGQKLSHGMFSLLTKSLPKAQVEVEMLTGFKPVLVGTHFTVMGVGNQRAVISVQC
ncbi:hypothetical protein VA249_29660 [Vibrio alfacsensis]|uniref:hypothetical protein n=1 Tax=Vibrio alfacsensis TaxID=1074311 RepID=UPI001BF0A932|nr:hypothetical protein [Vibrio alfacsensis]BBM66320.1 hypothetical protein VA249_29660 [Vibrio alfacsensis]